MFCLSRVLIFIFLVGFVLPEAQSRGRVGIRPKTPPEKPLFSQFSKLHKIPFESYEIVSLYVQKTLGRNITRKQFDEWIGKNHAEGKLLWIPRSLESHFRGKGWRGWSAFMGRELMKPYAEAVRHMRENYPHIKTRNEYHKWIEIEHGKGRSLDMSKYPSKTYKDVGWVGWTSFLNGKKRNKFKPYEEASRYIKENYPHIKTTKQYLKWIKGEHAAGRNLDMPRNLSKTYRFRWKGVEDFLGFAPPAHKSYEEVSLYIRKNFPHIKKLRQFMEWIEKEHEARRHLWIPSSPGTHYKNKGWRGWPVFLGSEKKLKSYEEASLHMKENFPHIKRMKDYYKWIEIEHGEGRNLDMPKRPSETYGASWKGVRDFLGPRYAFESYETVSLYVQQTLGPNALKKDYDKWIRKNHAEGKLLWAPRTPDQYYEDKGWKGWPAFFGRKSNTRVKRRSFGPKKRKPKSKLLLPLEKTIKIVREAGIKSEEEFDIWHLDTDAQVRWGVPENPARYYRKKGWVDWPTFLGQKFRSYDEVSSYVRENAFYIQTASQYKAWVGQEHKKGRLPWAPRSPDLIYAEVWKGWDHFLKGVTK